MPQSEGSRGDFHGCGREQALHILDHNHAHSQSALKVILGGKWSCECQE